MRYLILFLLLSSFTFAPTDRELLTGTWSLYEMKTAEGVVVFSADDAQQKEIIERSVKEFFEMGGDLEMDEQTFREMVAKQLGEMEKMTFLFDATGRASVGKDTEDVYRDTQSTYTLNEQTKEIMIKSGPTEVVYTYTFEGDKVTLSGQSESIILIRAK